MGEARRLRPDRRTVITSALTSASVSVVAACTGPPESTAPSGATASSPSSTPGSSASSRSSTSGPSLPTPAEWQPHENEVEVRCKLTAVRQVVAALTVDGSAAGKDLPTALRPLAGQVEGVRESVVEVVYPQYGGLTLDRRQASVMIVLDLITIPKADGAVTRTSISLDVRLRRRDSWQITKVLIPEARQYAAPLPDGTDQLLRSQRIDLPREARLDLASGRIDPKVVRTLTALSERWRLGVLVLRAAHPENVFGTNRTSNHFRGRAVDIWALDRIPVIAHDQAPWREAMEAAAGEGADEIGGPADIGSPGPPYFTNLVHQDHLHVGFEV